MRSSNTRSLNESRQQVISEFLPKVDTTTNTGPKPKEKLNITHYYTQATNENHWMLKSDQAQRYMPYSSNVSSVEAITNRIKTQSSHIQQSMHSV